MPDSSALPISPTVAAVFSGFLESLQNEKIVDEAAAERLRNTLDERKLDSESLRAALFGTVEPEL
jgi:hypothetical protein